MALVLLWILKIDVKINKWRSWSRIKPSTESGFLDTNGNTNSICNLLQSSLCWPRESIMTLTLTLQVASGMYPLDCGGKVLLGHLPKKKKNKNHWCSQIEEASQDPQTDIFIQILGFSKQRGPWFTSAVLTGVVLEVSYKAIKSYPTQTPSPATAVWFFAVASDTPNQDLLLRMEQSH